MGDNFIFTVMDRIDELFPNFDAAGKETVRAAYNIALQNLEGQTRGNGRPFIEHPEGVAKIAADEIGLPAECIASVFLHEAMRFKDGQDRVIPARAYDNTVYAAVCNQIGDNGRGVTFGGGVAVYDVRGRKMAEDFSGERMVTVDLDPEPLERIRAEGYESMRDVYFLDKRRPELYYR